MLRTGSAKRVTIHINEDTSARRDFLYVEIFDFLLQKGIAGASLIRPEAGFGSHHLLHGAGGDQRHMPVRIDFIESPETVSEILPELAKLVTDGLIEIQDTTIYRSIAGVQL
jgi:uncharacterized protein